MTAVRLTNLVETPELVSLLAEWQHRQFSYLARAISLEQRAQRFQQHLQPSKIPTTFVAWVDDKPVGCAGLVANDMHILPTWTPWLAGVYVLPDQRRAGIGSLLVQRVLQMAHAHHYARCYLYTHDREAFYRARGWQTLFKRLYRGYQMTVMAIDLPTAEAAMVPPTAA
jgi:GNAT superfamily N-acetyltransferase